MATQPNNGLRVLIDGKEGKTRISLSLLFTHEIVGHGYATQKMMGMNLDPRYSAALNHLGSVQTNNMYFRARGENYVDYGWGHYMLPGSNYNGIPSWYVKIPNLMDSPQ